MPLSAVQTRQVLAELEAIRGLVNEIVPGGRNPEDSYMAKRDAVRALDRLIGDETRGVARRVHYDREAGRI